MQFHFAVISKLTLEHTNGIQTSRVISSDYRLEVSKNLQRSMYLDNKGFPNKEALKPITNTLVTSLIAHIRVCGAKGWMKEGEHMDYIMKQIQEAFVAQSSGPIEGEMEY